MRELNLETPALWASREARQALGSTILVAPHPTPGVVVARSHGFFSPHREVPLDAPANLRAIFGRTLERGVYVPAGRSPAGPWHFRSFVVEEGKAPRSKNELPMLMWTWFGMNAGAPGAPPHYVRFTRWPDGWHATPEVEGTFPKCETIDGTFRMRIKVNHAGGKPILMPIDRKKCPGAPMGDTQVQVYGEPWTFGFRKIACNTAWRS